MRRQRQAALQSLIPLGLLVLVGFSLRTVLLGVPPVLPLVQRDLGLSHTGIGLLVALPVLIMGGAAWPGGLLAARFGGRPVVAAGLTLLAVGGTLRAFDAGVASLYLFTALFSLGIAITQPAVVSLIRQWFPERIGLATAMYTDGLIAGEAIAAGITLPLLLRWLGPDAWRASFAAWSLPVLLVVLIWWALAPRPVEDAAGQQARPTSADGTPLGPELTRRRLWILGIHLGLLSGAGSLVYFNMNSWAAPYDAALGHAGSVPITLAILNGAQLPVCVGMTAVAQRLVGRRLPFMISGALCLIAIVGWVSTPISWQPFWAAMLGASSVAVLLLGTALPPLYATGAAVARLAGVTLTVSYAVSFSGQIAGGRLWDLTGRPAASFLPVALASVALVVLGLFLPPRPIAEPGPRLLRHQEPAPGRAVNSASTPAKNPSTRSR